MVWYGMVLFMGQSSKSCQLRPPWKWRHWCLLNAANATTFSGTAPVDLLLW